MNTNINWDLFAKAVKLIEDNPSQHNQGIWHCGTAHCFAGWVQIIDLQQRGLIEDAITFDSYAKPSDSKIAEWDPEFCRLLSTVYGQGSTVSGAAKALLRLDQGQADWLFDSGRTLEDFQKCLELQSVVCVWEDDDPDDWADEDLDEDDDDSEDL